MDTAHHEPRTNFTVGDAHLTTLDPGPSILEFRLIACRFCGSMLEPRLHSKRPFDVTRILSRIWFVVRIALCVGLVLMLFLYGFAMREGAPVHFVVPNGFKGPIRLPLDPIAGKDIAPTNGQFVYVIPANGILAVKSFEPFQRWHKQSASYVDGTAIPNEYETWIGLVLHGGGESTHVDQSPEMEWFMGTKTEYERCNNRGLPAAEPFRPE